MYRIFIHGLGQGPASWADTLAALGQGPELACPDLAALLQGEACTYARLYGNFCAYCGQFAAPLDLCGLSLGAVLALHYAADHPAAVRSLVLIGPQYKMPRLLLGVQSALFRLMPQRAFRQMGLGKSGAIRLTASMRELDLTAALAGIPCPALVVCGQKDGANQKAARSLAAALPLGELCLVPGAGHEVNLEAPRALAAALAGFYQKHGV